MAIDPLKGEPHVNGDAVTDKKVVENGVDVNGTNTKEATHINGESSNELDSSKKEDMKKDVVNGGEKKSKAKAIVRYDEL